MIEYRRIKGRNTWHWCKNCPHWPRKFMDLKYIEYKYKNKKPTTGKLCKKCKTKERRHNCRT